MRATIMVLAAVIARRAPALPEEALRTVFAKQAKVSEHDSFGLLAFYGAESAISLILRDPANPVTGENGLRRLSDEKLAERIRDLPRLPLNHESPKHMSLAGADTSWPWCTEEGKYSSLFPMRFPPTSSSQSIRAAPIPLR
ncbi:MAG: hypothetical protein H7176_06190 [Bdellovibrionales bacterium]|nr:hypothetical protein [Massilia sp.]